MPFIKLDTCVLESSLWEDSDNRTIFITALLMADLFELKEPTQQLQTQSLKPTGWIVPPGWYGLVRTAGSGIIRRALMDEKAGMAALKALGSPDPKSRSREYDGRRLVRIDGGYLVLNYCKYREKDHTSAERSRRYRERKKLNEPPSPQRRRNVRPQALVGMAEIPPELRLRKRKQPRQY
jgi:hypothetical protein